MCWDISLHTDLEIVKKAFPKLRDERKQLDYDYRYFENVQAITFPAYPIIYKDKEGEELGLLEMEWGVLPTYIKDPKEQEDRRRNMINVRSERILADSKSYWHRLKNQRCLIPVSGTFEHRTVHGWKKKVPYFIGEKGREIFYIPGLYQWHEVVDQEGEIHKIGSFGMLTREANTVMGQIHNDGPNKRRMPLFLTPELEQQWLSAKDKEALIPIFNYEISDQELDYYPVYTLRGYPNRPDGKHRYEPYQWSDLPPLGQDGPMQQSLF
ncbi:SOS response-associated peptidase [Sphingobacterium kitahiroshimense]|uniref:SOS response-associated peptidase n=1 Tax=Sphingobacterium sp. B16(2022) TaxID=2914044 RepID=UPI00143BC32B|nr:SOS response-associated peptidase family protein [Sphingobacterium sp. B16(2022)]NJI72718.1 SOS response-associated peptidase [Sphingobacterium sp. B16(2022)]